MGKINLTRRETIGSLFTASGALALPGCLGFGRGNPPDYSESLLDRCWMWGHDIGHLDAPGNQWKLPVEGEMGMVEACRKMGIGNLSVIRWGNPPPEYRRQFGNMKRLTWPICGHPDEPNATFEDMCEFDFRLLDEMPNLIGFEMDDFFRPDLPPVTVDTPFGKRQSLQTVFSYDQLLALRRRMDAFHRPLDLRVVVYDGLLEQEDLFVPCADLATAATFWIWRGDDIPKLERRFRKFRDLLPSKPVFLGVYLWDFGDKKPMKVDNLMYELEYGLDLWRRREIEGFVFLATSLCNKNLPTVSYVRQWLEEHANVMRRLEPLPYQIGNIVSRLSSIKDNRRMRMAFEFLHRSDLKSMPVGRYSIDGDNVYAIVQECDLKPVSEAKAEAHRRYIDIQTPLTGEESYGVARLTDENFRKVFDSKADVGFYDQDLEIFTLRPGQFAMFQSPRGLHAPGLTMGAPHRIRKLVVKVKYRTWGEN